VQTLELAPATNVTDGRPVTVADNEFTPGEMPRVQLPTVATPAAFVAVVAPVTDPPPDTTENVTDTSDLVLPLASLTTTDGRIGTTLPAAAV